MKPSSMIATAAVLAAIGVPAALSLTSGMAETGAPAAQPAAAQVAATEPAPSGPAPKPDYAFEKCYGVVKAGHNDCQTASSSCAGTSKTDMQADAWVYLPAGTCDKIAGGNAAPKA